MLPLDEWWYVIKGLKTIILELQPIRASMWNSFTPWYLKYFNMLAIFAWHYIWFYIRKLKQNTIYLSRNIKTHKSRLISGYLFRKNQQYGWIRCPMKPDSPPAMRAGSPVLPVTRTESPGMSSTIPVQPPMSSPKLSEPPFPPVMWPLQMTSSFFLMKMYPASSTARPYTLRRYSPDTGAWKTPEIRTKNVTNKSAYLHQVPRVHSHWPLSDTISIGGYR